MKDLIELAQLRRRTGGLWVVTLVVEGYDDEYERSMAGNLSKEFAAELAGFQIWRQLRKAGDKTLAREMVILKSIERG